MNRWSFERSSGTIYLRCSAFDPRGLVHGFGLRSDDVGPADAPTHAQLEARRRLVGAVGAGVGSELRLGQVHGAEIVEAADLAGAPPFADGIWARSASIHGRCLAVRTADCVPLLIASRDGQYCAAVHAGWRGTRAKIAVRAVEALIHAGAAAAELIVAIGPAIGLCCYRVSEQVARKVATGSGVPLDAITRREPNSIQLDLQRANRLQFVSAGVQERAIHGAPWCTACHPNWFFSYRRDSGAAGRQLSLIGPRYGSP